MITIYWHCLGMTEADQTFVNGALDELAQHLKDDPIKLPVSIKRLGDKSGLTKKVDERLNRLSDQSYTFSVCACDIGGILPIDARLFVYCAQDSNIAKAAQKHAPWACWGATCGSLSAVYKSHNKFVICHEVVHLLLRRTDNLDECYEPYPPYAKKCDCDCESCLMQHAPSKETVGEWPSLCNKVIKLLQDL